MIMKIFHIFLTLDEMIEETIKKDEHTENTPEKKSGFKESLKKLMKKYSFPNLNPFKKDFINKIQDEPEKIYPISGRPEKEVNKEFDYVKGKLAEENKDIPRATGKDRWEAAKRNLLKYAINAAYTLSPITHYKTYKLNKNSLKLLKEAAEKGDYSKRIHIIQTGMLQNKASALKKAQQSLERGNIPFIKSNFNYLSAEKQADKVINYVRDLYDKTGYPYGKEISELDIKTREDARKKLSGRYFKPNAVFDGHSTGGLVAEAVARHKEAPKFFKAVYAFSPDTYGVGYKNKTIGQSLLVPLDSGNITSKENKERSIKFYKTTPNIPVYEVVHSQDQLVTAPEGVGNKRRINQSGGKIFVITHPDATHFGSSGQTEEINNIHLDIIEGKYDKNQKPGDMYTHIKAA